MEPGHYLAVDFAVSDGDVSMAFLIEVLDDGTFRLDDGAEVNATLKRLEVLYHRSKWPRIDWHYNLPSS